MCNSVAERQFILPFSSESWLYFFTRTTTNSIYWAIFTLVLTILISKLLDKFGIVFFGTVEQYQGISLAGSSVNVEQCICRWEARRLPWYCSRFPKWLKRTQLQLLYVCYSIWRFIYCISLFPVYHIHFRKEIKEYPHFVKDYLHLLPPQFLK